MSNHRKIVSWEPEHRRSLLDKRGAPEGDIENFCENEFRGRTLEISRYPYDEHALFSTKIMDRPMRGFSPIRSHMIDNQQIIIPSFREPYGKFSQRSIVNAETNFETRFLNESGMEFMGMKGDVGGTGHMLHDNNPLNNSGSDLENDIFKIKNLPDKESMNGGFREMGNIGEDRNSFHPHFAIDTGLSELAPIKPPNAYRQITSINYSNYNDKFSQVDPNLSNQAPYKDAPPTGLMMNNEMILPQRIINSKEIFDLNRRKGITGSMKNMKIIRSVVNQSDGRFNPRLVHDSPVSERMISLGQAKVIRDNNFINPREFPKVNFEQMNKFQRNVFHNSEKSISINEELMRKRYQMKNQMMQYNNNSGFVTAERRRDFSPFDTNEISHFASKEQKKEPRAAPKRKQQQKSRHRETLEQDDKEKERKKIEDKRIENNMKESIEMIELGQFKRYRKLLAFLISLFVKGQVKLENVDLNEEELQILKIIIYRKFKKHIDIK